METSNALHVVPGSPHWPRELDEIADAPRELWLRGRLDLLAVRPRVAIVGTRAPSPYGVAQAQRFATALAHAGVCVVSGLARGIDRTAHDAVLDAGGATLAVLGCGVDRPWPANATTEEMTRRGLLLSEFEPGVRPRPYHFPLRNRLISALASSVVVVEAAARSGSLITAHWAADQGRTVFALPGRVDHPMARGVHVLIREGATLVESPAEVLAELSGVAVPSTDSADEEPDSALLRALRGETLTAGELAERTSRRVGEVLAELVREELAGRVVRAPGGLYRLAAVRRVR